MLRVQGTIDLSAIGAIRDQALVPERRDGFATTRLSGVELRWDPAVADVALKDSVLVLSLGRARGTGSSDTTEAERWRQRYLRLGDRTATDVGGGFAAVVVDFMLRRALLFVDRFSIETLCYRIKGPEIGFSDAADHVPGSPRAISAQSIFDYFYFHVIPAPKTLFEDVRRIEEAHVVAIDEKSHDVHRYWHPQFTENRNNDFIERSRLFVETVRASVAEEADEPGTACFLSGGTDSSTAAGMLTRIRGEPTHAYSIGFDTAGYDEMAYARIAARHFGLIHHEYYVTPDDLVSSVPQVAASFDQPFGNSSVLPAYYCALRAKQDGFTRMLAGDGGDELFGGNSRYAVQKSFELYHALPEALRSAVLEPAATRFSLFRRVPGFRQVGGYVRHAMVAMPARLETFNLLHQLGIDSLFEPKFLAEVDLNEPAARQLEVWNGVAACSLVNKMLGYDWKFTLADSDLPKVRGAVQLAGMTVGYPFLGRAITDFSLALPAKWKLKGFKLRWLFKKSLKDFLPPEILRKKKHGFGLPFGHWVQRHAELRALVRESLDAFAQRGIVRRAFASGLLESRLAEAPGYYGEMVWILMMLELWLRARRITLIR